MKMEKRFQTTNNSSLPSPLREEKSFSQRAFSIYTDIRKLQDKEIVRNVFTMAVNGKAKSFA